MAPVKVGYPGYPHPIEDTPVPLSRKFFGAVNGTVSLFADLAHDIARAAGFKRPSQEDLAAAMADAIALRMGNMCFEKNPYKRCPPTAPTTPETVPIAPRM